MHLSVPGVGIQGPAVRKGNRRAMSPFFVVNLSSVSRKRDSGRANMPLLRLTRVLIRLLSGDGFRYSAGESKEGSLDSVIPAFNFRRECNHVSRVLLVDRDRCT